ncbi:50S ribosomal protein L5 [uncultured archaeon]|nr:50S ribosomal protein L5 [uncultured archaeon]
MKDNIMRQIEIEKMTMNCGGVDDKLDRSIKLLEWITKRKIQIIKSSKRIPDFGISPGKKSGCKVTIRDKKEITSLLKRFFAAMDNKLSKKQISENHVSFGLKEYIEIPGLEYNRDIGILGFEVDLLFSRKGRRVKLRKVKQGRYPKSQAVTIPEMTEYLKKNFNLEVGKK